MTDNKYTPTQAEYRFPWLVGHSGVDVWPPKGKLYKDTAGTTYHVQQDGSVRRIGDKIR